MSFNSIKKEKTDQPMNKLRFKVMSCVLRIRDIFISPKSKLTRSKVQKGLTVLDYGCGPGSLTIAAAEAVGESGKVYGADIHPLAATEPGPASFLRKNPFPGNR